MPDQITERDDLTAALSAIRDRSGVVAKLGPPRRDAGALSTAMAASAADVPRLLAAVDAVLKVAEDWATERPGDHPAVTACGRSVREVISRALTGEDAS